MASMLLLGVGAKGATSAAADRQAVLGSQMLSVMVNMTAQRERVVAGPVAVNEK